jgi:hypothetical protein
LVTKKKSSVVILEFLLGKKPLYLEKHLEVSEQNVKTMGMNFWRKSLLHCFGIRNGEHAGFQHSEATWRAPQAGLSPRALGQPGKDNEPFPLKIENNKNITSEIG